MTVAACVGFSNCSQCTLQTNEVSPDGWLVFDCGFEEANRIVLSNLVGHNSDVIGCEIQVMGYPIETEPEGASKMFLYYWEKVPQF